MKSRRRALGFETLESLMLLSSVHPVHAAAHKAAKLPAIVMAAQKAAQRIGSHVTVTPVLLAPGSVAEYQITFQAKGQTYTTDITITNHSKNPIQPG